ncbi:hypothetical protein LRS13_17705 [Svornostia abyssi]|uniref:Tetratricopeptide repeat protein n=1 Tax=Svornostia abyssi TaxID=2898438 RepID=A0ABY5PCY0_9ACTN|nr:hypothetical protein LRS13_17705 [Parviterribacteraceae bacterium J379]
MADAGEDAERVAVMEGAVRRFPDDPDARVWYASALLDIRPAHALEEAAQAAALDVDNARRIARVAHMHYLLGATDEAARYLKQAIVVSPPHDLALEAEIAVLGGQLAAHAGEAELAEEAFRAAVETLPEHEHYWVVLVQFLADRGRLDDARRAHSRATRVASESEELDRLREALDIEDA